MVTDRVGLICHTSVPCKNGSTNRHDVWDEDSSGPRELCIRWGPHHHGNGQFWGGRGGPLQSTGTLRGHLCKNGGTNGAAIWVVGSDWPNDWRSICPHGKGQFWQKGAPTVKYRDFLPWAVQKGRTDRFAVWVVDSGGPMEEQVQSYPPGGANVSSWEGTMAPSGKYDWTVHLLHWCGLMSNDFDHLSVLFAADIQLSTLQWTISADNNRYWDILWKFFNHTSPIYSVRPECRPQWQLCNVRPDGRIRCATQAADHRQ